MEIHVINLGGGDDSSKEKGLLGALLGSLKNALKEGKEEGLEVVEAKAKKALEEQIEKGGGDNFNFQKNVENDSYFFSFKAASIAVNEGHPVTKRTWGAINIFLSKDEETGKVIKHNHLPVGEDCKPYELQLDEIEQDDWLIITKKIR